MAQKKNKRHRKVAFVFLEPLTTNDSMLQTFTEEISVTIDSDGEMLEYEAENEVVRGGIDISKEDSEMGSTHPRAIPPLQALILKSSTAAPTPWWWAARLTLWARW